MPRSALGPLSPEVLDELEHWLGRVDMPKSPAALAARLGEIAAANSGARPERDLCLYAAAVALWGAHQCARRDRPEPELPTHRQAGAIDP